MAAVEEDVLVAAPVETVFEFMDDPENQAAVTPSLSSVDAVEHLDNGGKRVTYVYSMAGVSMDGTVTAVEYDPPRRIDWELSGSIDGEIWQVFDPEDGHTRVTYGADYSIPVDALDRLAEPIVRRYNQREVRTTLQNLKDAVEARAEGADADEAAN